MKKKIHRELMMIAAVAILLTGILATFTYYRLFQEEVFSSLETCTRVLAEILSGKENPLEAYHLKDQSLRVTIIAEDGSVLMDSNADIGDMGNHAARPEIIDAFQNGSGRDERNSETLGKSNFYYAIKMEDGNILRTAKEAGSIFSIFMDAVPSLIVIAGLLVTFCAVLSHFLTKSLVEPVEKIAENLDGIETDCTYKELSPFLTKIQQQHQNLLKSAKMRQSFTANVTHELKTPLTSISGYAELIESGITNEADSRRFAKEIHKNARRLIRLINDILQLSELDTRDTALETEPLNLYDMAAACVEMLKINASLEDISLKMSGSTAWIEGNRSMIEEVLYNLCSNAIRYNKEHGSVNVYVNETSKGIILKVSDTGIGIPQKHQERVFERFYRVDKSRSKERGGTGLGLAIVKHIIAEHHAQIFLESEENIGTTITVLFPKKENAS